MKPIIKKAAAAIAIKEGIDRLQEMRQPKKPSIIQRVMPLGIIAAIAGVGLFVYKNRSGGDTNSSYDVDAASNESSARTS